MDGLIEIEDVRTAEPLENEVPLAELIAQHRYRYDVTTSIGRVRLRFIGELRRRQIELRIHAADPEISGKRQDLRKISALIKEGNLDSELKNRQLLLAAELEPSFFELFAGAFDVPAMKGGKEVQALADALRPEEWRQLRMLLIILIAAKPAGEVQAGMIEVCRKYGVSITDDLTMENMTAQQWAVMDMAALREIRAMREAMQP